MGKQSNNMGKQGETPGETGGNTQGNRGNTRGNRGKQGETAKETGEIGRKQAITRETPHTRHSIHSKSFPRWPQSFPGSFPRCSFKLCFYYFCLIQKRSLVIVHVNANF